MTTAERTVLFGISAVVAGGWVTMARSANIARNAATTPSKRVQASAPPSAPASSYDVPYAYSADLPYANSVRDAIGRTVTISGIDHVTHSGVNHIEIAEPAPIPVPVGITFGAVTSGLGDPVVTAKPSGWIATLHGSGFPTTGILRLQVAGRIAPASTIVWRPTTILFTVPPGPPSATGPVTGPFDVYIQESGVWRLLGRGGAFTILPTAPGAARR